MILAQTGVGQTGFEGNVPGEDIDETVAMLIREMAKEARSTLRRLAALAASYPPPGAPALDADDMSVTRASRHLPGDLDAGLMPGTELGGVQVTAHRRHEPGQQGSSRVGAVRLAPGARTLSPAVACVAD